MNLYYQQNRGNKQELQKMIEQIEEDIQLVGIFHLFLATKQRLPILLLYDYKYSLW